MKQYTTPDQTAKLIELGFEKPKSISSIKVTGDIITTAEDLIGEPSSVMGGKITANYTIGELIEMLPMDINNDGRFENLLIHPNYYRWVVKYSGFFMEPTYQSCMEELIDALYYMILKLKEEEVI